MNYSNTILVIKGSSEYRVLRMAADLISGEFEKQGYETAILDTAVWKYKTKKYETDIVDIEEWTEEKNLVTMEYIANEMCKPYAFIFSCQAVGSNLLVNPPKEKSVMEFLDSPYIGWIFDHPNEHAIRLNNVQGQKFHLAVIDNKHKQYVQKHSENVRNVFFLPHGGFRGKEENREYQKRQIDIFCPGTCGKENDVQRYADVYGETVLTIYNAVFEMAENNPDMAIHECFEKFMESIGMDLDKEGFWELKFIMELVDNNIRYKCKAESVRTLLSAGYQVTVSGQGWEKLKQEYPKLLNIKTENMDIEEVVECMQNSKIVLNLAPTLTAGLHERILTGLLAGAAVITPYNSYISKELESCKSLYFFTMKDMGELPKQVGQILDEKDMERQTKVSVEYVSKYHTWEKRAQDLVRYVEHIKNAEDAHGV